MYMLVDSESESLLWQKGPFWFPGLVRLRTIADGSCFFHAIANAFYQPYRVGMIQDQVFDRIDFIRRLRADFATKLASPNIGDKKDGFNRTGCRGKIQHGHSPIKTYYETISRGQLPILAKDHARYQLANMQKELNSFLPVDNLYNEFISNILNKDIYLLDLRTHDVYVTGSDMDILYKGRPSIVILTMPGHYELVGLDQGNGIRTLFDPKSDLIQAIRNRMKYKIETGSKTQ